MDKPYWLSVWWWMSKAGVFLAMLLLWAHPAFADPPVRPQPGLPPRPPYHKESNRKSDHVAQTEPLGHIELHVSEENRQALTGVFWRGADRLWYPVEGWRGRPNAEGIVRWAVAAKDFGRGPYVWIVFKDDNGSRPRWWSNPFYLPGESQIVQIYEQKRE